MAFIMVDKTVENAIILSTKHVEKRCFYRYIAVEQYAVEAVRDCINYSDHLSPFVSDNDKEPSWDGHIYIYRGKKARGI